MNPEISPAIYIQLGTSPSNIILKTVYTIVLVSTIACMDPPFPYSKASDKNNIPI